MHICIQLRVRIKVSFLKTQARGSVAVVHLVEWLSGMHEALGSMPRAALDRHGGRGLSNQCSRDEHEGQE